MYSDEERAIEVSHLDYFYGAEQALFDVSCEFASRRVTALIGPSGCGKTTFLRTLNRMNDDLPGARLRGQILIDGVDIYRRSIDVADLRRRVGMVFQKSNPFPRSVHDNVAFGPRLHGARDRRELARIVEHSLRRVGLWDEVKDRLHKSALDLSGGQQQRLCIARALAVSPQILLMDEPASALDPKSTARLEQLIHELRDDYTIVIVTHSMHQAARLSDTTGFFFEGRLVELSPTARMFTQPQQRETEDYISGRTA